MMKYLRCCLTGFLFLVVVPLYAAPGIMPGDRIAIVGNTFADQLRIHGYLETLLMQRSQEDPVVVRNLGWGGDMLTARDRPTNFPSEEKTLTEHKTDVIIACFGMGESFAGEVGLAAFRQDLRAFIDSHRGKKYNGKTPVELILVTPIAYEYLGKTTPNWEQRNRELAAYSAAMAETALENKVGFVNLFEPSRELMENSANPPITSNGIHLNPTGYWALSRIFADSLVSGSGPWRIYIDVTAQKARGDGGVVIPALQVGEASVEFTVSEQNWPTLPAPSKEVAQSPLRAQADTVEIKGLSAGTYALTVDGDPVATATAEEWGAGVVITNTPAHQSLAGYRQLINDKNQQFIYSWKALNQVHIVGERKKSASGRALPGEVVAFNDLAKQRDVELHAGGVGLANRTWKLTRSTR